MLIQSLIHIHLTFKLLLFHQNIILYNAIHHQFKFFIFQSLNFLNHFILIIYKIIHKVNVHLFNVAIQ